MPWYGMHLIDRVRNQAAENERSQRRLDHVETPTPPATTLVLDATPTLAVVALWAAVGAGLYCAATGISEWNIVLTAISGPLAMAVIGAAWGSHKSAVSSGLDAAIVTGAVIGASFVIGALI